MNILKGVISTCFIIIGYLILAMFIYFIFKTLSVYFKSKIRKHSSSKRRLKHFLWLIRNTRYVKFVEFFKWVIIDTLRGKDKLRLFGIWAFTGYYGEGKTMGCVQFAKHLQRSYPHRNIKIFSNIEVKGQVRRITNWEELLHLPPNSIFIYDESQADWSCNNREFPDDLLRRITQCRKKQFAMFMTSPKFNRMNINIRESVNFVIVCKNIFQLDRWFRYVFYRAEDFEDYQESKLKLMQHKYLDMSFVIQDRDYKLYNTVEEVETIKVDDVKVNKKDVPVISDILKKFRNDMLKEIDYKFKVING